MATERPVLTVLYFGVKNRVTAVNTYPIQAGTIMSKGRDFGVFAFNIHASQLY
jgi:hypothetical protein